MSSERGTPYLLSAPVLAVFALMVLLPLVLTTLLSFQRFNYETGLQQGFTLEAYATVLGDPWYWQIFGRTGWVALLVAQTSLGVALIWILFLALVELTGPVLAEKRKGGTPWHPHHIA